MKYAITGHTQGIGKAVYEKLLPNCIGFSRTSGYDITNSKDRRRIIEESIDCDVFINNATDGKGNNMGQTLLLIDLFYIWKDLDKKIINVGSRVAEYPGAVYEPKMLGYQAEKLILKEMSIKLAETKVNCKIEYKWFGYVGTESILKKYPHFTYPNDYIFIDEAVNIILN